LQTGVDGFVVSSPWSLGELAEVLGRLCDDEALRARMGDEARLRAERFTMETRLKELMGVLAQYDRELPRPQVAAAVANAA
jgi:glycosyltransferase involved in cell wall biosynthesis